MKQESTQKNKDDIRTAIVPVQLRRNDYQRAHDAAHVSAELWNKAVDWVHSEWKDGNDPSGFDICKYLKTLPKDERHLHTHTTCRIALDLAGNIATYRKNKKAGSSSMSMLKIKPPWRKKNYRPLSFSRGYGWRISGGRLHLSLGRGRDHIILPIPKVTDSATGAIVLPECFGEIRLCWDRDARKWSLHIPYSTARKHPDTIPGSITAIDEGIINPMALAAYTQESTGDHLVIDVLVINGREGRAIKRQRNKANGQIQKKLSRVKNGSKKHRRLMAAKKSNQAKANNRTRNFDHQVTKKASRFIDDHQSERVVVGDVSGIERNTKKEHRIGRSQRQQLSQWSRGRQEHYLAEKSGREIEHINESGSTKTCPACGARNRPSGRDYRCGKCGFTSHRDAVGAINILQAAIHGAYVPIDPNTKIRITYLRAVPRWNESQQRTHRKVESRSSMSILKTRARSSARNLATGVDARAAGVMVSSSTTPHGADPMVEVA